MSKVIKGTMLWAVTDQFIIIPMEVVEIVERPTFSGTFYEAKTKVVGDATQHQQAQHKAYFSDFFLEDNTSALPDGRDTIKPTFKEAKAKAVAGLKAKMSRLEVELSKDSLKLELLINKTT